MTWFRVDDTLGTHPKARRAGLAAMGVWVLSGSWASQQLTDGFVPEWFVAGMPNGRRHAATLVRVGLWIDDERDGVAGWRFHEWAQANPTRDAVLQLRAQNAARQAKHRANGVTA